MRWTKGARKVTCQKPTGESFEQMPDDSLTNTSVENSSAADHHQQDTSENKKELESKDSSATLVLQHSPSWTAGSVTTGSGSLSRSSSRVSNGDDVVDDIEEGSSSVVPPKSVASSNLEPPVEVKDGKNDTSVFIDDDEVICVKHKDTKSLCDRFRPCLASWSRRVKSLGDRSCPCLASWSRRERILLAIIAFLGVLVLILFSTNMSLVRNSRSQLLSAQVSAVQAPECDGTGNVSPSSGSDGSGTNSGNTTTGTGTSNTEGSTSDGSGTSEGPSYFVPGSDSPYPPNVFEEEASAVVGDPDSLCGCAQCTQDVWNMPAGEFTCGERISYLVNNQEKEYPTQVHACRRIAFEFPCACGSCDPGRCGLPTPEFFLPENWEPVADGTPAPTPITAYTDLTSWNQDNQSLYCYPVPEQRAKYTLWGGMVLQVKEDANQLCGPGNNRFTRDNVVIDTSADTLTLQYKNGVASEVRVLLPENQRPFTYGTYSFSVKSVAVKNASGQIISDKLPKELVLGMFTWDDTESYAIHENWNHEVDIEISRWNCETNSDLQFLVQPPGFPQMHRLFTGNPEGDESTKYKQGGHVYSFDWEPAEITWDTSAGTSVNNNFVLKTEEAVFRDTPDYVQCLKDIGGNMEVRLNLWNMLGNNVPQGLSETDVVEVVFDNFSFTSSGVSHLANGDICSKHCQCEAGVSQCIGNVCTSIV